jgi:hypothetical protein
VPYKVQILNPGSHGQSCATCISHHWKEEHALSQVEAELPQIIARGWKDMPNIDTFNLPKAFIEDALVVLEQVPAFFEAKVPKAAYALWRDFADAWIERGVPVGDWWGDILVEESGVDKFYFYPTRRERP